VDWGEGMSSNADLALCGASRPCFFWAIWFLGYGLSVGPLVLAGQFWGYPIVGSPAYRLQWCRTPNFWYNWRLDKARKMISEAAPTHAVARGSSPAGAR
jgi:hypothetical protein